MARQVHREEEKSVALGAAQHVHGQTQAWMQQELQLKWGQSTRSSDREQLPRKRTALTAASPPSCLKSSSQGRQLQGPGRELREPNAQGREDVLRASIPGSDGNYAPEWMELQQCDT